MRVTTLLTPTRNVRFHCWGDLTPGRASHITPLTRYVPPLWSPALVYFPYLYGEPGVIFVNKQHFSCFEGRPYSCPLDFSTFVKPISHYAVLACVWYENVRGFALMTLQSFFFGYDDGILKKYFHNHLI